jgi:hypothetical protein
MKLLARLLRRLSWVHSFVFVLAMFAVGAVPVFVAFFVTNGASASSIAAVAFTAAVMVALARVVAAIGAAVQRRLLARYDEPEP